MRQEQAGRAAGRDSQLSSHRGHIGVPIWGAVPNNGSTKHSRGGLLRSGKVKQQWWCCSGSGGVILNPLKGWRQRPVLWSPWGSRTGWPPRALRGEVSVLGGSRLQSQGCRGVLAAAGAGMGLPQHGLSRAVPAAAVCWAPQAWTPARMKLPSCSGHGEGPGKCFAVRMGARKAKEITQQKAPAETSPPFLSQRLLGRCCRRGPCGGERVPAPGRKGSCARPSSARGHRAGSRRAAPSGITAPGSMQERSGGGRWVGQRCPVPSAARAQLPAPRA